jgi:hypothetical protein
MPTGRRSFHDSGDHHSSHDLVGHNHESLHKRRRQHHQQDKRWNDHYCKLWIQCIRYDAWHLWTCMGNG